jgi:23S rRNA (pseudouridine1915-N3)-methyltransferase
MKTRLIMVGRTERGFVADGVANYMERVKHWSAVELVVVPKSDRSAAVEQRMEEERAIVKALPQGGRLVVLDEVGVGLGSLAFAQKLGAWRDQGVRETTFVIGGAYGLTEEVRRRADLVLSLSPMTFPHQLVRVLFAEQLYRAWSVLNGSGYHH